jgi:murein DD-endopeptidase MepM/ murein hydrolase activator NlpD
MADYTMKAILPIRGDDKFGAGFYRAPRGDHTHKGVDFCCSPGSKILAIKGGVITKLGYCYSDDLSFRYVEIMSSDGLYARYLYVEPSLRVGDHVMMGDILGHSQSLDERYKGITEHVHFECFEFEGIDKKYLDPNFYYLRV